MVGIVLGFIGVGLIGGVSGWLIARKTGGIKDPPQSKLDTSINSGRTSPLDTETVNASPNYENFPRNEQDTSNNAEDGNSTYTMTSLVNRRGRLAGNSHMRRTTLVEEATVQNVSHF
ncbi:uncharacterized protein LOC132390545 isoform X3 [Hypanus sabinus]|uniref:uncharacterized protein LOC132390545 isoform X3 n=1 Tax=Hypanus sabinus TaxID=79690 RepID=UPI0028C426AC|nr:uncharacterized protein LOC132390545 isoform X3 [Hypanus sabinus]